MPQTRCNTTDQILSTLDHVSIATTMATAVGPGASSGSVRLAVLGCGPVPNMHHGRFLLESPMTVSESREILNQAELSYLGTESSWDGVAGSLVAYFSA